MRIFRLRRPTPALIVSLIALTVALGGTSYAALSIPKNSVGTKQLKNKAVTNAKLGSGSVGTGKIKNGAVTTSKINTNGLTVPNALSANSATSLAGVHYVTAAVPNPANVQTGASVACPTGENAIAGGASGSNTGQTLNASFPAVVTGTGSVPNGWDAFMLNGATAGTLHVYAICAALTGAVSSLIR
jgi:hypothetical protein